MSHPGFDLCGRLIGVDLLIVFWLLCAAGIAINVEGFLYEGRKRKF